MSDLWNAVVGPYRKASSFERDDLASMLEEAMSQGLECARDETLRDLERQFDLAIARENHGS